MQTDTTTLWIASLAAGFLLFKILTRRPKAAAPSASDFDAEMNEILTNDKYKVKGRFE